MKEKVIESFNRIALLEDKWDHNQRYSELLLKKMGHGLDNILDIGCGTGEFTVKAAKRANRVTGVDIAPQMIIEAQKRHQADNIEYILQDFESMKTNVQYDCIVSIAAFHHLQLDIVLPKILGMLKPGGALIVLDLYERKGALDLFLDIIAVPLNIIVKLVKNGRRAKNRAELEAWNEHISLDHYMTIKALKSMYKTYFYDVKFKRLIFWRYATVCRKEK
ncbi:MAG TPA: methyltransferase domain-containing protein [Clostridia bacterium]|nr:methyltransferase domain-containing protein [Clostridia bacterium]